MPPAQLCGALCQTSIGPFRKMACILKFDRIVIYYSTRCLSMQPRKIPILFAVFSTKSVDNSDFR